MFAPFKKGDIVRLRTGNSPMKVMDIEWFEHHPPRLMRSTTRFTVGWYVRFAYVSSLSHEHEGNRWRKAEDFVSYSNLFQDQDRNPEHISDRYISKLRGEYDMKTLWQTKGDLPRFGTYLTTNSHGKVVLEMKGKNGDVEVFDKNDIEEVLPHTVGVKMLSGDPNGNQKIRHYESPVGEVEVGNILMQLTTGNIFEVVGVDTKVRSPSQTFNGFIKLADRKILLGQDN